MRASTLRSRSLTYHWRMNLAVILSVTAGTAALTGALLVGDSMRGSLREQAVGRLGRVDYAMVAERFFRDGLPTEMAASSVFREQFSAACPIIVQRGGITHADSGRRVSRAAILGVDRRFWELSSGPWRPPEGSTRGRRVVLNRPLADELGAAPGDDLLLRLGKPAAVPGETLLGRRDDTSVTLRLTVGAVLPAEGLGAFGLHPQQRLPRNAFVPLRTLQGALDRRSRANALLVAAGDRGRQDAGQAVDGLRAVVKAHWAVEDFGLRLRVDRARGYCALESERLLLEPAVESAALAVAQAADISAVPVLVYLANSLELVGGGDGTRIPYSIVAGVNLADLRPDAPLRTPDGRPVVTPGPGEIVLNDWAASDLGARMGDQVRLSYYITGPLGRLDTVSRSLRLVGVLPMDGPAADPGLTPEYPGITDSDNLADWNPPFPVDLGRLREQDERYWDQHRTTPKAFVSLAEGQSLWAATSRRFGRLTSILFRSRTGLHPAATAQAIRRALPARLDPAQIGFRFHSLRQEALDAGRGSTDFGGLFLGFSLFVIGSAAMLVALTFRLGVERRAGEVGLLLAAGFPPRRVARLLLGEGALLAGLGGLLGLIAGLGYAWLMLVGLRTWWSAAVQSPFLRLHVSYTSLLIGLAAGYLAALGSVAWSIRGLTRLSPRALLAGAVAAGRIDAAGRPGRRAWAVAVTALILAAILLVVSLGAGASLGATTFFGSGAALLVACLAGLAAWADRSPPSTIHHAGRTAITRLGIRNASHHRGRSLLTAGLIASATFLIVSVGAFRLQPGEELYARSSGTGGFLLLAEAAIPLPYDLNTPDGRRSLNLSDAAGELLAEARVFSFRLRQGEEASCLNLYRPTEPRIIGARPPFVQRGGFIFADSLAESDAERENPWILLDRTFPDGAVPVIGDLDTVRWQLHLGLGQDLHLKDQRGHPVRLRFVGLLKGSVLAGELIVAEAQFVGLFPSVGGYAYFLLEGPATKAAQIETTLEDELAAFSLDLTSTTRRLSEYQAVQNTYLSTFQTLGGLGLVLGTFGMAAVLLRNVWERRSELALLRALGFRRWALGWMVLAENGALLVAGLAVGCVAALLAVAPQLLRSPQTVPWASLGGTLLGVLGVGMLSGLVALRPALRTPLLPALRAE